MTSYLLPAIYFVDLRCSSGIGLETCRELLAHGATVYMFIRTPARAESVIKQFGKDIPGIAENGRVKYIQVDLSDMKEVRRAGEDFLQREQRLDILRTHITRVRRLRD